MFLRATDAFGELQMFASAVHHPQLDDTIRRGVLVLEW